MVVDVSFVVTHMLVAATTCGCNQHVVNVFHGAFLEATWNKLTTHAKLVDSEEELNLLGEC